MLLVTSFNEILYREYGERMVREFSEHSDGSVKLIVVFEGDNYPALLLKTLKLFVSTARIIDYL
jgi:hypothetical protein